MAELELATWFQSDSHNSTGTRQLWANSFQTILQPIVSCLVIQDHKLFSTKWEHSLRELNNAHGTHWEGFVMLLWVESSKAKIDDLLIQNSETIAEINRVYEHPWDQRMSRLSQETVQWWSLTIGSGNGWFPMSHCSASSGITCTWRSKVMSTLVCR